MARTKNKKPKKPAATLIRMQPTPHNYEDAVLGPETAELLEQLNIAKRVEIPDIHDGNNPDFWNSNILNILHSPQSLKEAIESFFDEFIVHLDLVPLNKNNDLPSLYYAPISIEQWDKHFPFEYDPSATNWNEIILDNTGCRGIHHIWISYIKQAMVIAIVNKALEIEPGTISKEMLIERYNAYLAAFNDLINLQSKNETHILLCCFAARYNFSLHIKSAFLYFLPEKKDDFIARTFGPHNYSTQAFISFLRQEECYNVCCYYLFFCQNTDPDLWQNLSIYSARAGQPLHQVVRYIALAQSLLHKGCHQFAYKQAAMLTSYYISRKNKNLTDILHDASDQDFSFTNIPSLFPLTAPKGSLTRCIGQTFLEIAFHYLRNNENLPIAQQNNLLACAKFWMQEIGFDIPTFQLYSQYFTQEDSFTILEHEYNIAGNSASDQFSLAEEGIRLARLHSNSEQEQIWDERLNALIPPAPEITNITLETPSTPSSAETTQTAEPAAEPKAELANPVVEPTKPADLVQEKENSLPVEGDDLEARSQQEIADFRAKKHALLLPRRRASPTPEEERIIWLDENGQQVAVYNPNSETNEVQPIYCHNTRVGFAMVSLPKEADKENAFKRQLKNHPEIPGTIKRLIDSDIYELRIPTSDDRLLASAKYLSTSQATLLVFDVFTTHNKLRHTLQTLKLRNHIGPDNSPAESKAENDENVPAKLTNTTAATTKSPRKGKGLVSMR